MTTSATSVWKEHADRDHAILAPSSASRWMACPGSLVISKGIAPKPPSEWALEGTRAHEWIERILPLYLEGEGTADKLSSAWDELMKECEDMYDCVLGYCEFVDEARIRFQKAHPEATITIHLEYRVKFSDSNWGTADFVMIAYGTGYTHVMLCDYKHGKGVDVDVKENKQLANYLFALEKTICKVVNEAYLFVYQPRTGGKPFTPPWILKGQELVDWRWKMDQAIKRGEAVYKGTVAPTFKAGDHCRFCPALGVCPERQKTLEDKMDLALADVDTIPTKVDQIPVEKLVQILAHKKQAEKFLDAVEAHLTRALELGMDVPGFKLVRSQTKRGWDKGIDEANIAKGLKKLGIKEPWRQKLITIGDAEKALGKGKKDAVNNFTDKPEGRLQIVPVDDERDAIEGSNALLLLDEIKS